MLFDLIKVDGGGGIVISTGLDWHAVGKVRPKYEQEMYPDFQTIK
jgi:hypothetical protein